MASKKNQFPKSNKTRRSPIQQEEYNCCSCENPDSYGDMVQCDNCDSWSHYSCAGVDSSIQNRSWTCITCTTGKFALLPSISQVVVASAGQNIAQIEQIIRNPNVIDTALNTASSSNIITTNSNDLMSLVCTTTSDINLSDGACAMRTSFVAPSTVDSTKTTCTSTTPGSAFATSYHDSEFTDAAVNAIRSAQIDGTSTYTVDAVTAAMSYSAFVSSAKVNPFNSSKPTTSSALGSTMVYNPTNTNPYVIRTTPAYCAPGNSLGANTVAYLNAVVTSECASIPTCAAKAKVSSGTVITTTLPNDTSIYRITSENPDAPANHHKSLWSISSRGCKTSLGKNLKMELQMLEEERILRVKRDREEQELKAKRDSEYLEKKYRILSQIEDNSSGTEDEDRSTSITKVKDWLGNRPPKGCLASTNNHVEPASTEQKRPSQQRLLQQQPNWPFETVPLNAMPAKQPPSSSFPPPPLQPLNQTFVNYHQPNWPFETVPLNAMPAKQPPSSSFPPPPQQPLNHTFVNDQPEYFSALQTPGQQRHVLTSNGLSRANIASRQLISRDLQCFGGSPDEWPLFISNFHRSTELCAFTDEENLVRLQRALKGKALEAVRSLLIQPNCVPRVLSTLKMLYGDPELVIHTLTQKIQSAPAPKAEKLETLVSFALIVQNLCATIEATGLVAHLNNATILHRLVHKLPPAIRLDWAKYKREISECNLSHFSKWIYHLAEAANSVLIPDISSSTLDFKPTGKKEKGFLNVHDNQVNTENLPSSKFKCCICQGSCESVVDCKEFQKLNRTLKWSAVKNNQLCRRCLRKHSNRKCLSTAVCGKDGCTFKHHRLLHNEENDHLKEVSTVGRVSLHTQMDSHAHSNDTSNTLFRIVPVTLYHKDIQLQTFAFLDDGSSLSLMDEEIAKKLNVKGASQPLCLKWTGNHHRYENNSENISLQISGTASNAERFSLTDVHTVENLLLPEQSIDVDHLQQKYEHLRGLPIQSYQRVIPRLLIGLNNSKLSLPLRYKEGSSKQPVATKTRLGWVVHGCQDEQQTSSDACHYDYHSFHSCECNYEELQRLVKEFVVNDNFGTSSIEKIIPSTEDKRALELLTTYTIRKNGRFETSLLWKSDKIQLPNSLPMAKKRLSCLHKRMRREPLLSEKLESKIQEYISKGYARKLTAKEISEENRRSWYLPIFPVQNQNKPGKLRIVWDAAAKVQGVSLNSMLLKGPDQLTSLNSVIYKARENLIAICGDIMEMFHQVQIRKEDRNFQRFLWSKSEEQDPDVYVMNVMTFGATCSPCCAQFIKNKNADEFIESFPRAVRSIKENHYVDDLMDSVATEEEAIRLAKEIRFVHNQGGFLIRNWISNSPAVLKALKTEPTADKNLNVDVELTTEKVLGMWWCTSSDCFTYKLTTNESQTAFLFGGHRPTKRDVLRILMTIFDPLGLLAHFLMYIKVLLQDIWRSNIDWDEEIKDAEYTKWLKWVKFLPMMETLKIPRCYITNSANLETEQQLHVFVDASENGFAAVAYVRTSNVDMVECSLVGAKTRVAPLKSLSIPRLELQAAVLGARFAKCIVESHTIQFSKIFFWSDSKNVLSWIRSDHRKYRQFVAFRVSEILDLTDISNWRWISTKTNVADEGTKWQKLPDFKASSRWFNGPDFLKLHPDSWPQEAQQEGSTEEELKAYFINIHAPVRKNIFRYNEISRWIRLLRSTAFALRFVYNTRSKRLKYEKTYGPLSQPELLTAERSLIKEAQASVYGEEIADLEINNLVETSSSLYNLCPCLDENGIIRANSRIQYSEGVDENVKRPIILPRDHRVTHLIILDVHFRYNHQNHETVVNEIRQKYHICQLRAAVAEARRLCQVCKNNRVKPLHPIMAQLPPARLASFCRPFSFVGVDYFGPMNVTILRRTEKRWGVLLTCLTTRAVHLEIAHSLTSDSCIMALRNFIGRRGTPIEIYSDNGTKFVGAERELKEAFKNVDTDKFIETFTSTTTKWKFIPPGSPHMGGSWERLVRSVKNTLYQIMPTKNPSEELLRNMLIEVENVVNSRPLTYIPIDNENEEALTPNHFLLGSSSGSKPLAVFDDDFRVVKKN